MARTNIHRFPWIGVVLIVIGGALLINRLGIFHIGYSYILWSLIIIFGVVEVTRGFSGSHSGRIFLGTVMFLYGLYFLLRATDYVELRGHMLIPATFIIMGFAFIMMYLNNLKEWAFLIPAVILVGVGGAYILSDVGYLYPWEVRETVRLYWPVGLILIGVAIVFRRRAHTGKQDDTPGQPPPQSNPQPR